ncbi:MAG: hypothetical protein ACLUNZ_12540 [Evtepia sp.]
MDLLVVGGGGREHAIIKKLKENPVVETIYALPGNGGIAADAVCVPEIGATEIGAIVAFAVSTRHGFRGVAPDDPLALGACGPRSTPRASPASGRTPEPPGIGGQQGLCQDLMKKYHIPTAQYEVFDTSGPRRSPICKTASFPHRHQGRRPGPGQGRHRSAVTREEAEEAVRTMHGGPGLRGQRQPDRD